MTAITPIPLQSGLERLLEIASGFMAAKHLFVASAIGVFEALGDGAKTIDELAQRTGMPQRTLRIVVDAVTALGLLVCEEARYRNSAIADTYLSGNTGTDLRPFLAFWDRISYPAWQRFEECVRRDAPAALAPASEDELELIECGVAAITTPTAQTLALAYDFAQHQRLLDLGGGATVLLSNILRHYPPLQATLFESPVVADRARAALAADGLHGRVQLQTGDLLRDPLPAGHDLVLSGFVAHTLTPDQNRDLLRRARAQVRVGARLLLVDFWTEESGTAPPLAALLAGEFALLAAGGNVYSQEDAQLWVEQAGWRLVDQVGLAAAVSLIVAEAS